MTESDAPSGDSKATKRSGDFKAKLILLAAVAVVGGVFYVNRLRDPAMPEGFITDLEAAREKARDEIRPLLILFWSPKVDKTATRHLLGEKGLPHKSVVEAIEKGKYVCVGVKLGRQLDSDPARKYKITRVPTLVVLSSMGIELARLEGGVGHGQIEPMLAEALKKGL